MMEIKWSETTAQLKDLKPYERNPRRISKDAYAKLKASIEQDGFHQRILCTPDLKVIGGHQRIRVLKELGWKEIQVLTPSRELTEEEYRRLLIRDNLQAGEWDMDALANDFTPEELADWGFPEDLLPKQEGVVNDPAGDEDEAPAAPAIAKTIRGDVYEIGPHRLMCGDSTLIDDVDKLRNGVLADQLVTDPPYNIAYEGKTKDALTIQNDKMDDSGFRQFLSDAFIAASSAMKPGAVFYIWHADSEGYNFRGACKDAGWQVRQCLIWQKQSMVMGRQDYHWQHEPCLYGWKDGAGHLWASDRKQTTILKFDRPSRNGEHPTMKPVNLIEYQIGNNTKGGDIVLDLFGGSGSTMVAAHKLGRTAYLMELDEKYCDVIVQRMAKLFPDLPVKRNGQPFAVEVAVDGKAS
jgi:site-specific DNA-methyltransferase (adenine-specific)